MPENQNINIELRSEEVQEILGHIPSWIVRWGITTFLIILLMLFIGSGFFAYPDVVSGDIEILSENPPVEIKSNVSGYIDSLLIANNQQVDQEQVVAIIKNPANYLDVLKALEYLKKVQKHLTFHSLKLLPITTQEFALGSMQNQWSTFISSLYNYEQFILEHYYDKKTKNLFQKIEQQENYIESQYKQIKLEKNSLNLAKSQYSKDSLLFSKAVIAESEFDRSKQTLISKQQSFENSNAILMQAKLQLTSYYDQLTDYSSQEKNKKDQLLVSIRENIQILIASIEGWQEKYLIKSTKNGKVSFTGIWSDKQPVQTGETVCTILPDNPGNIIGRIKLRTQGAGKVEVGQRVNIKLLDYPYMEFGYLQGTVKDIAQIPVQDNAYAYYWVYVDINKPIITTYNKEITFRQKMPGTAEIITKDLSVLDRFLQPIMHAFKNK
jgi:multidrug resistance efflux pump